MKSLYVEGARFCWADVQLTVYILLFCALSAMFGYSHGHVSGSRSGYKQAAKDIGQPLNAWLNIPVDERRIGAIHVCSVDAEGGLMPTCPEGELCKGEVP